MKEQLLNEVENIVAKGEIAHLYNEQLLLILPQCFQKSSAAKASIIRKG